MIKPFKNMILFSFLVLTLLVSTIVLSVLVHESVHILQVATTDSITEVNEVCILGWSKNFGDQIPVGWVLHTDDEEKDIAKNSELPAYYFQIVAMLLCLYLSSKILFNYCTYMKGGQQE
jgi:hypothetical protein